MSGGEPDRGMVAPSPDVLARTVGTETVLVHVAKGRAYGLNRTAARLWALLESGLQTAEIEELLSTEYGVDRERIRLEVEALIEDLLDEGLLVQRSPE